MVLKRNERAQINKCKWARDVKVREEKMAQNDGWMYLAYLPPTPYSCACIGVFGTPVDLSTIKSAL